MKKTIWLLCLLLLLVPTQVFAHSKVTESSPAADATVDSSPEKITIAFNSTIASMSTFKLFNENNEEQVVDNISVAEHELTGDVSSPLANGVYTVQYNIIGADGHAIDGSYSFTIAATEATPTPTEEVTTTTTPEVTIEPTVEPTSTPIVDTDSTTDTKSDKNQVWPFIIIGLIIVAAVAFAMKKRK
ncbi:copper resistance CopC family protein [Paenibacillus endoradicis]|uniref:copper resistance CopC family protein n=1 Tax=Paenibacillus endoradicis TaxID=2972487 RepID=UPI0021599A7F|nr:copper resistance protein CopC [Paenibacillus endoradicis]MCR8655759.1 copper resistance protein CopC [Paenibacillus endoradicis]MCR8658085.1 copper resistance protein CopC [Paenibacillus endoradicis]